MQWGITLKPHTPFSQKVCGKATSNDMNKTTAQKALDCIEEFKRDDVWRPYYESVIAELEAVIAQPVEPLGWLAPHGEGFRLHLGAAKPEYAHLWEPIYATPQEPAAPGWLPISQAPKDGTDVIVMYMHIDTQIVHNAFWLDHGAMPGWWSYDKSEVGRILLDDWMTPTHYMPLPPEPGDPT